MGDSKTFGGNWIGQLIGLLSSRSGQNWVEVTPRFGIGGYTAATMKAYIDANLAAVTGTAELCNLNLGANDVSSLPTQATWKANMTSIIDSLRAKWPGIKIYVTRPWRRGYATECNSLATWIGEIVATYPSNVFVGDDERTWLENGDNGVTYTTDGTHYNAAGDLVASSTRITVMGY